MAHSALIRLVFSSVFPSPDYCEDLVEVQNLISKFDKLAVLTGMLISGRNF